MAIISILQVANKDVYEASLVKHFCPIVNLKRQDQKGRASSLVLTIQKEKTFR
jgi:hypothetical protein